VTFFWGFKSVDASGIKLLEFSEFVDPVCTQRGGVSDKLTPNGSAEPVVEGDIHECVDFEHRRGIVARRRSVFNDQRLTFNVWRSQGRKWLNAKPTRDGRPLSVEILRHRTLDAQLPSAGER
jgi:hypothetical protein